MREKIQTVSSEYKELLDIIAEIIAFDILNKIKRNDKENSDA